MRAEGGRAGHTVKALNTDWYAETHLKHTCHTSVRTNERGKAETPLMGYHVSMLPFLQTAFAVGYTINTVRNHVKSVAFLFVAEDKGNKIVNFKTLSGLLFSFLF